jgi:ligand-binding sensor domain-containing protein/two-component sensor histidine kinase
MCRKPVVDDAFNDRMIPISGQSLSRAICALLTVFFFLLCASRSAMATGDAATQYRFNTWKTEQGLPQNSVKTIRQTQDGYLWFGTRFGIVRFDGVTFQVFDRINTPTLASDDNCITIAEEKKSGALWFATPQGIVHYHSGVFTPFKISDGKESDRVQSMCLCSQGGVWIATADGLKRMHGGSLTRFSTADGLPTRYVTAVFEDTQGTLWIGTEEGLCRRDPDTGKIAEVWRPENPDTGRVQCIFKDGTGALWLGTMASGLLRFKNGAWTRFSSQDGITDDQVDFITEDRDGNIWVTGGNGELLRFRNGRFELFGEREGLAAERVLCVHEDREGNLWIGTVFGGLKRVQPVRIQAYSTQDGLAHNNVWTLFESRNGGLWAGTDAGFSLFRDGKFTNYPLGQGIRDPIVKSIFEDRAGRLWIGTINCGLRGFRGNQLTEFTTADGLTHDQINAIYQDSHDAIWVGTLKGLNCFHNGLFTTYSRADGLSSDNIRAILEDHNGVLWFGTYDGGLNRYEHGRFTSLTTADGLSDNYAWCIHEDKEGALWIGTEHGLNRLKDGHITRFTTLQGLFDNVVNDVIEDDRGNLWISCNRGIYRVSKKQLEAVANGTAATVEYVSYGTSDGMLSSETNGEFQPDACKTRDGRIWFPTTDGIVMIDPEKIALNDLAPPVVIEEVLMDRHALNPTEAPRLGPGRGGVMEVRYTANSLVAPEKVRFRYCLDGCDQEWIEAGSRRVAYYTNLRPGHYTFRVTGCNNHGIWNPQGAKFSFDLAPHFYQTWPFYLACGLALVAFAYALHWVRLGVVRKIERLEKQHALEQERARIASEMHDDLGSSLTQIALLSELANRDLSQDHRAGQHIQNIMGTTREVFRAMDEIVWAVNPKHDTLSSLVGYLTKFAQDFLRPAGIRCRLDLPPQLPPYPLTTEVRHNLFLTVKEALNNIAKHAGASEVWVRVALDTDLCAVVIEDNGRGFQVDSARPGGNGLANMKKRLGAIGGQFSLHSLPGNGTKLELIVRLKPIL